VRFNIFPNTRNYCPVVQQPMGIQCCGESNLGEKSYFDFEKYLATTILTPSRNSCYGCFHDGTYHIFLGCL
jgi:hypothetical protein